MTMMSLARQVYDFISDLTSVKKARTWSNMH